MSPSELDLVDSHCHLDFPDLIQETEAIIARARAAGVNRMVTICTRLKNEPRVRALAEIHPEVFYAAGIHPMSAHEQPLVTVETLVALARHRQPDRPRVHQIRPVVGAAKPGAIGTRRRAGDRSMKKMGR